MEPIVFTINLQVAQDTPEQSLDINLTQADFNIYRLFVKIFNGAIEFDYLSMTNAKFIFTRPDGVRTVGLGTLGPEGISYDMETVELAIPGLVIGSVQLLNEENQRLTCSNFLFHVVSDPLNPKETILFSDATNTPSTDNDVQNPIENGDGENIPVNNCTGITIVPDSGRLTIHWTDPDDTELDGEIIAEWAMTKLVRKTGGFPTSENDGTLVVANTVRDQYQDGYTDTGLVNGTTYYYKLFPISTTGAVNDNAANNISGTPSLILIPAIPSQSGTLTYSGSTQSPSWANYDAAKMTLSGTISGTTAGSYSATFTPGADYQWPDGTTAAKTVVWTITKAPDSLSISPEALTLDADNLTGAITVTRAGDGVISAVSSDTSVATVSVNDTVVTVNSVNQTTGTAAVTISVAEGSNHLTPADRACAISVAHYAVYGVSIDLTNSNPETAVTYTDDAVGMAGGSSAWDSMPIFKDIKPCMLKNGAVQYYLNPSNFAQKADGSAADITSGNDGDVMIEFPKTGFQISTVGDTLTVKITDAPNKQGFRYYAHTRVTESDRDMLYIGAYFGNTIDNKLRSLSNKAPKASQSIDAFITQANANGPGYDVLSFYALTLIQCLYLIRFKSLDSQSALGRGYTNGSGIQATGASNAYGMNYGSSSATNRVKCLGIEDLWGSAYGWICGVFTDASRNILTAFNNFNGTGSGYTNRGQGATTNISGFMIKPQGTTETGFIAQEAGGSSTTYFADSVTLNASCPAVFGGNAGAKDEAGIFRITMHNPASYSSTSIAARLMYL